MRPIGAGTATLHDRRTERSWTAEVAPFLLGAVPVTRALYAEVLGGTAGDGAGALPAVEVSWLDAVRWCNAVSVREGLRPAYAGADTGESDDVVWDRAADGYRLPTEAEWEHACRAGTAGPRYGELDAIAWHRGNSGERLHEVAGREPNPWGLYDMLGNAWEWCFDVYDREVYRDYRVIKGGGWFDEHWSCRAGVRRRTMPGLRIDDLGFRPARNA